MSLIKFQCPTRGAPLEDPGKGIRSSDKVSGGHVM